MLRNGRGKSGTTFYCFSPLVMVSTFLIEAALIIYVIMHYKLNKSGRIIVVLLACLASFQLAEYMVCEGMPSAANNWARFGFAAITLLPPLGLWLVNTIRPSKVGGLSIKIAFSMAALLIVYFVITPGILPAECMGNYVIFTIPEPYNRLNGFYYYAVTIGALVLARKSLQQKLTLNKKLALRWYTAGVLAFLIPSAIMVLLHKPALEGIPSIMCGFALIFALILAFKVIPRVGKQN